MDPNNPQDEENQEKPPEIPPITKEEIQEIIKECVDTNLHNQVYHHNKVPLD